MAEVEQKNIAQPKYVKQPAPETIKLVPALDIAELTKLESPIFKKIQNLIKEDTVMENVDKSKPNALLMLEYLEKNKNSTMQQMQIGLNIKTLGEAFIIDYIKNGHIKVKRNDSNKKMYSLTKPISEFYKGKSKKTVVEKSEMPPLGGIDMAISESISDEYEIPAFLRKSDSAIEVSVSDDTSTQEVNTLFENEFTEKTSCLKIEGKEVTTIRFAFTSDKTLMIIDGNNTQELDVVATQKLMDFCENISMSLVV